LLIIVRKKSAKQEMESKISEVMSVMGQRSAQARKKAWGTKEFKKRMKEFGKLGGRPKKSKTT
jgi:ribosomal protein S6